MNDAQLEELREALNGLNLKTNRIKLGDAVAQLLADNEDLKARVAAIEGGGEEAE